MSGKDIRAIVGRAVKSGLIKLPVKAMDDDQRKSYYREYTRNAMRKCRAKRYALGLTSVGQRRLNRTSRNLEYTAICGI